MKETLDKETALLFARMDDLCRAAGGGVLAASCFLSPRELHFAEKYIKQRFGDLSFVEWGGYRDAERKKVYILPEYMEDVSEYSAFYEYGYKTDISTLEIVSSGYKKLTHRDFLGSVLGLGLERSVIGDIFFEDRSNEDDCAEKENDRDRLKIRAILVCESAVASFICENLERVGSDTVKVRLMDEEKFITPKRSFVHVSDTLASERADCIVAALLSLSREKAKQIISAGLLEINYDVCERVDKSITAPCVVSIRGYGKFRINSLSDRTKKGRLRLDADKYV